MKNAKVSSVYEGKVEQDEEGEAGRSRAARQNAIARMRKFKRVYVRAPRPCGIRRKRVTRSTAWSPSASLLGVVKEKEDEDQNQYMNNNSYYHMGMAEEKMVENHGQFVIDGDEREAVVKVEVEAEAVVENLEEEKSDNKKVDEKFVIDVDEIEESSGVKEEAAAAAADGGGNGGREESKWASGWYDGIDDWPMEWSYEEEWLWMGKGLGLGLSNPQWEYVNGVGWIDKRGPEI